MFSRPLTLFAFCWGAFVLLLPQDLTAQSNDLPSVIELQLAHTEQNGGHANISAFRSLIANGVVSGPDGKEVDFKLYKKRPNLIRMHLDFPAGSKETVFDGEQAFEILSKGGIARQVLDLSPVETARLMGDSTLEGPFYSLRSRPEWLEVVAEVEVNGRPAYEIKIDPAADSHYERIWLDKEHLQEVKLSRGVDSREGGEMIEEIYFSDFERVRGLWFAKTARYMLGGELRQTVQIEKVRANAGIFDSYFKRPDL